jgi:hypothetical protein
LSSREETAKDLQRFELANLIEVKESVARERIQEILASKTGEGDCLPPALAVFIQHLGAVFNLGYEHLRQMYPDMTHEKALAMTIQENLLITLRIGLRHGKMSLTDDRDLTKCMCKEH